MVKIFSPLRYPGGKAKFYKIIQPIVSSNIPNGTYIEPFAGGAGLALKLLFEDKVDRIVLNDFDYHIYCFWKACLEQTDEFCELVETCDIDLNNWYNQKNIYSMASSYSILETGFATFFLNRCNVSGVIAGGPIGGRAQTGKYLIDARFNKPALVDRIKRLGERRDFIQLFNEDASAFLQKTIFKFPLESTLLNIDPPYVKKGAILYENSFEEGDHAELSNVIKQLEYKWIITYDECELIHELYSDFKKEQLMINYSAGQTKKGSELLIIGKGVRF